MNRNLMALFSGVLLVLSLSDSSRARSETEPAAAAMEPILRGMADAFVHKIPGEYELTAQINIQPELESGYVDTEKPALESWHVVAGPGRKVVLHRGPNERARIIFSSTDRALRRMSDGRMNSMTATLASTGKDPTFLRWQRPPGVDSTPELRDKVRVFQLHFFNPSLPERFILDAAYARVVHGSPAVGLYYHPGFRSAWYEVRKGKRLNEPGDTNPHHQAFIFVSGEGMAKIGEKTVKVKAGEAYYIPPGSDHVVWTERNEPLALVWMAWGEGA